MKSPLAISPAEVALGLLITAGLIVGAIESPRWQEGGVESDLWTSESINSGSYWATKDGREFADSASMAGERFLPDANKTPGAYFKEIDAEMIGKPGYSKKVRDVPLSLRKEVFARYGIPWSDEAQYECDHLVSIELAGSNAIENLWPEPYEGPHGARIKDQYEDWLHREVIAGRVKLRDAQKRIATDWITNMKRDMPSYQPPHQESANAY